MAQLRVDYDELNNIKCLSSAFEHRPGCLDLRENSLNTIATSIIIRERVLDLLDTGITRPRDLQRLLLKDNNLCVPIKKIYSLIHQSSKRICSTRVEFSISDFEIFCKKHQKPKDSSNSHILAYSLNPIRVFITSEDSLVFLSKAENLHIDATYKLNTYNFPVIIVGVSDSRRSFFCSGIILTENEDLETFVWIMNEIKKFTTTKDLNINFTNLVADNAPQITKLVSTFSQPILRTNCWAHVYRLMQTSFGLIKEKSFKDQAIREVKFLQSLTSKNLFDQGLFLFRQKYLQFNNTRPFIGEFFKRFVDSNSNWYESFDIFNPSTNNCLEGFNLTIKKSYFNWCRLEIVEFVETSFKIIENALLTPPHLGKILYESPERIHANWNFKLIKSTLQKNFYLVSASIQPYDFSLENFFENFETFDSFYDFYSKIIFITTSTNIESYKDLYCSCFLFSKKKKCSHMFNFLKDKNLLSLVELNVLNSKKSRGRPKKIKPGSALVRDDLK